MKTPALCVAALPAVTPSVFAQDAPDRPPLPDMAAVAAALGVTCDYCHAGRGAELKLTASASRASRWAAR